MRVSRNLIRASLIYGAFQRDASCEMLATRTCSPANAGFMFALVNLFAIKMLFYQPTGRSVALNQDVSILFLVSAKPSTRIDVETERKAGIKSEIADEAGSHRHSARLPAKGGGNHRREARTRPKETQTAPVVLAADGWDVRILSCAQRKSNCGIKVCERRSAEPSADNFLSSIPLLVLDKKP